ncbi:T9SS type A sorting domain-containing protein [Bizionia sp. KMM 8389]
MKKITFLLFTLLLTVVSYAQCTFTSNYPWEALVLENFGESESVSTCNFFGEYSDVQGFILSDEYIFTADTGYITLVDTADGTTVLAAGPSPLTWVASVANVSVHWAADSACSAGSDCVATSVMNNSVAPPEAPDCASTPFPADGAVDVPNGNITFTWVAPTTGPAPTSYNLYAGETPTGDDYGLIGNFTELSAAITLTGDNTLLYWVIKPVNGFVEATGCPVWSFTTAAAPPAPDNDLASGAYNLPVGDTACETVVTGDTTSATLALSDAASCGIAPVTDIWFSVTVPNTGEVTIETSNGVGVSDTVLAVYEGTPASLTEVACNDDFTGLFSQVSLTGRTEGEVLYVRVWDYSNAVGTVDVCAWSPTTLSVGSFDEQLNGLSYFPNPVTSSLTLQASQNIENVLVYNMLGQEVLRAEPNAVSSEISMNSLQDGAYFVKVTVNGNQETIRIIKK